MPASLSRIIIILIHSPGWKYTITFVSVPLMLTAVCIFKKSYDDGEVPEDWKTANITPVFKKGKRSDTANYRPISLTCIACKPMEHVLTSNIMMHVNDHNILYLLQHGFREGQSCETQLVELVNDLANDQMQSGGQTDFHQSILQSWLPKASLKVRPLWCSGENKSLDTSFSFKSNLTSCHMLTQESIKAQSWAHDIFYYTSMTYQRH